MKSRIFESINDRSNIISAYSKMVSESVDEFGYDYDELQAKTDATVEEFSPDPSIEYPIAVYSDDTDGKWIDLADFEYDNAKKSNSCEYGSDEFYFNYAFEKLDTNGVYGKIKEEDHDFVPSPLELERAGATYNESDLYSTIVEIGKSIVDDMHKNDIAVSVPRWALSYLVNADDSALSEEEKKMIDDWEKQYVDQGYTYVHDGEDLGFMNHPSFGLADDCERGYFVKYGDDSNVGESTEVSESEETEYMTFSDFVKNHCEACGGNWANMLLTGIKNVFPELYKELDTANKQYPFIELVKILKEHGIDFEESSREETKPFFDENGYLQKEIPEEAVKSCSQNMGKDNYDDCKYWVGKLDFTNGLDIPLVKEYLKATGGWEPDEIRDMSDEEAAIRIFWLICCDLNENGMDYPIYIADYGRFDESVKITEHTYYPYTVTIDNIMWSTENADKAQEEDMELPTADKMDVEADTDSEDDLIAAINNIYIDSFGFAPDGFDIVKKDVHPIRTDGEDVVKTDDSIKDNTLAKMKKEHPDSDIKVITEEDDEENIDVSDIFKKYSEKGYLDTVEDKEDIERVLEAGFTVKSSPNRDVCYVIEWERTRESVEDDASSDSIGNIDSDYDDNGIYHEFPKTTNKINSYRQKFRIHPDGSSKFDELSEELHDALDGCTKGFFDDNTYSVVDEVMKRIQSLGVFTTITKVENTGIRSTDGLRQGKNYRFDASWTNKYGKRMIVHGIVQIFFCGTVDEPEKKYDACVHFFTDDGNYIKVDC